jgi:histidine ammonia-lyase
VRLLREAGVPGPGPDRFLAPAIEQAVALVAGGAVVTTVESVIGDLQ